LQEHFAIEAAVHEGNVTFSVAGGAEFVPKLFGKFSELGIPVRSVPASVVKRLVPGVTWDGWHVPVALELGVVAMMAVLFITIAALEFRKVD
jgi:hypothetical protein